MKKVIVLAILFMATAGVGTALATEYHCQASGDKSSITKETYLMTISCMKSNQWWQCTRPVVGDMECSWSSEKKNVPSRFWDSPAGVPAIVCGPCSSGWIEYKGGTTF